MTWREHWRWVWRPWKDYFTSSDPQPDTLFWHSFCNIIWKYIWRIMWVNNNKTTHLGIVDTTYKNCDLWDGLLLFYPNYMLTLFVFYHFYLAFFKSLDEGFSTFSMVCACLNPPPCIKGDFFFPSSKVLVSQAYSWKTFPCSKDFSRPSVFPQWRFALKAAKKIKNKIKSRRQTHTPGKNTCDRTLQICIKHAMCFSQWYVPVLIF